MRLVVAGGIWAVSGQVVSALTSLVLTPALVRSFGPEGYGVLALVNAVTGFLAFADIGMGLAATKFGAEAHARGDERGEASVVWTSLVLTSIVTVSAVLAVALGANWLAESAFRAPAHLHELTAKTLRLAAVGFAFRILVSVLTAAQLVRLRFDLNAGVNSAIAIAQTALILAVLAGGGGLIAVVALMAGANLASTLTHAVVSSRLLPTLVHPEVRFSLFKPLLQFSLPMLASNLAAAVLVNGEKLLITRLASVTALAYYSIAFTVAALLSMMAGLLKPALLPAFARLRWASDQDSLHLLYNRALRGTLLGLFPLAFLIFAIGRPFLSLWAGPEYGKESLLPLYLLVGGLIFNVMAQVPNELLKAFGRTDLIALFHLSELVPYLLAAWILIHWFGATGAALAWSLRVAVDSVLFFIAARNVSGVRLSVISGDRLAHVSAIILISIPALILAFGDWSMSSRTVLVLTGLAGYGWLVLTKVLTTEERTWLKGIVPFLLPRH